MAYDFLNMFKRLREEVERLISELEEYAWGRPLADVREGTLEPLTQIHETPEEIIISMDLPFVRSKDDVKLYVSEREVIVEANICKEVRFEDVCSFYRRAAFRKYRKVLRLPEPVKVSEVRARFKDGLLEVRLVKEKKGVRVKVE